MDSIINYLIAVTAIFGSLFIAVVITMIYDHHVKERIQKLIGAPAGSVREALTNEDFIVWALFFLFAYFCVRFGFIPF